MGVKVVGALVVLVIFLVKTQGTGPFDWMKYDTYDEVIDMMDRVTPLNCRSKPANELRLPKGSVSQLPRSNKLLSTIIYPNRTSLVHLHNMALNRAFYWSYTYQKLNYTWQFHQQPGLMYYYFSNAAIVSANEYSVNGSSLIFDNNKTYANWFRDLDFNYTLPLFGPRAYRLDDYNDPTNWLREPTNTTIDIIDYGAGPQSNYSNKAYKINEWYDLWLPDDDRSKDSVRKHSYDVGIMYSNETGRFVDNEFKGKTFFGPPSPGQNDEENLPVLFTQPYYDCGRSNKWIVSATSPVVDKLPRYLDWDHLRRFTFVASAVVDIDFLALDINPCPIGEGNPAPNIFGGTARCKSTTMCEPLWGWGFQRGGYQCVCRPGYRLPPWQDRPFQGADIESATEQEYKFGFDCIPVQLRQVLPILRGNQTGTPQIQRLKKKRAISYTESIPQQELRSSIEVARVKRTPSCRRLSNEKRFKRLTGIREGANKKGQHLVARHTTVSKRDVKLETSEKQTLVPRYGETAEHSKKHVRRKRQAFDPEAYERMTLIRQKKERVTAKNCATFRNEDLELPGDVAYNVENLFKPQAQTALRLAHFLSNFMQNVDFYEEYGNLRGDRLLNVEQIFGEVLSNVMADYKVKGSGVFYDIDKFRDPTGKIRQFFGPYAYKFDGTHYRAVDFAGYSENYLDDPWFKNVKERWQSNTFGLIKFTEKPMIRADTMGDSLKRFEMYPMYYKAPSLEDGWWSAPYFDCDGFVNEWIITYSVPFFGLNSIGSNIEFKGVVIVDVGLNDMDINQCPANFHVPNAFKNTARCHFESTYCVAWPGLKWQKGGYKCECKQGFEYHFKDRAWYFDGQTMEKEYEKMILGQPNRFNTLRCRISSAGKAQWNMLLFSLLPLFSILFR